MRTNIPVLVCIAMLAHSPHGVAEIYQWRDEQGQVHYGDSPDKAANATPKELEPANTIVAPEPRPEAPAGDEPSPPVMSAADWASAHCAIRVRILYTERPFIPCVPTDETSVYICERLPPRKFRHFFGQQYRYEDRESQCGPEVYEGEILFLRR